MGVLAQPGFGIDGDLPNHYKSRRRRYRANMTSDYLPAALTILAGVGMQLLLTAAAKHLGPHRPTMGKQISYEAGSDPIGSPRARFSVKFYQVAILFLVFDIEVAFLYPWAVSYRALS